MYWMHLNASRQTTDRQIDRNLTTVSNLTNLKKKEK